MSFKMEASPLLKKRKEKKDGSITVQKEKKALEEKQHQDQEKSKVGTLFLI